MNNSIYKKGLAVVLIIVIIIMAVWELNFPARKKKFLQTIQIQMKKMKNQKKQRYIFVDIDGAVVSPGVYKLIEGSRVIDAINLAGGLKEKAFTQNLNKARNWLMEKRFTYI